LLLLFPALLPAQAPDLVVCAGEGFTLTCYATTPSAITYQWYEDDGTIPNSNTPSLNIVQGKAAAGTYTYRCETSAADCGPMPTSNTLKCWRRLFWEWTLSGGHACQ
jgi:hypothetical protein